MNPIRLKSVTCPSCSNRRIVGVENMAEQLRATGKLRRDAKPEAALVAELYLEAIATEYCEKCGETGLQIADFEFDEDDWGDPILCEVCKNEIPPERMEIFPNETRCAACKDKPVESDGQREFCDACGGLLVMRQRGGAGITAYVMACSDCGRKA